MTVKPHHGSNRKRNLSQSVVRQARPDQKRKVRARRLLVPHLVIIVDSMCTTAYLELVLVVVVVCGICGYLYKLFEADT